MQIRRASSSDTPGLVTLLNEIIAAGGTTAITEPYSADSLADWMEFAPTRSAWHVATQDDRLLGVQIICPNARLPDDTVDIATFARRGQTQRGIGSRLFDVTRDAARALGYSRINATIRADNVGGLAYYDRVGFRTHATEEDVRLPNGLVVGKVHKTYIL